MPPTARLLLKFGDICPHCAVRGPRLTLCHDALSPPVHVIGGGLAGSEAAWQFARHGVPVVLHEMRPFRSTAVHKTGDFAELVCSNSFRSDDAQGSAIGVLHEEMRRLGSLVMRAANAHMLPAGGALAVDREGFAAAVTAAIAGEPRIEYKPGGNPRASRRVGQRDRGYRSPHLARTRRDHPRADRRNCARFLRCHRADRASRYDRFRYCLVPIALRQIRTCRVRRRLRQLSADPRAVRNLRRSVALPATRSHSTNSKRPRPISTVACRSK